MISFHTTIPTITHTHQTANTWDKKEGWMDSNSSGKHCIFCIYVAGIPNSGWVSDFILNCILVVIDWNFGPFFHLLETICHSHLHSHQLHTFHLLPRLVRRDFGPPRLVLAASQPSYFPRCTRSSTTWRKWMGSLLNFFTFLLKTLPCSIIPTVFLQFLCNYLPFKSRQRK